MKKVFACWMFAWIGALLWPLSAAAFSVTFLNPGKSDEIYWVTATHSMESAAHNLGIQLEVMYAERNHLLLLEQARKIAARPVQNRPDYVILSNDHAMAGEAIRILDAANIKTFLAFSGIADPKQREQMGVPRQIFKTWLGSLEPHAEDAGLQTARALIEQGRLANKYSADGKLHMIVLAGDRSTTASLKRNQGMREAVAEAKDVVIDQEVYSEWSRSRAFEQSGWLYKRYPGARLVWCGSDLMAFGAMESWREKGGIPGVDAFFSGINTSSEAFTALESGTLSALSGGHFIAGAFALVMLYDYQHGHDFIDEGLELDRSMFILFTRQEALRFRHLFARLSFDKVDFRRFSKVLNPGLKTYNFSFRQLLNQTERDK